MKNRYSVSKKARQSSRRNSTTSNYKFNKGNRNKSKTEKTLISKVVDKIKTFFSQNRGGK